MSRNSKSLFWLAALLLVVFVTAQANIMAAEVLVNGNLESSVAPVGWTLDTFVTGEPGSSIPSVVEHVDGGNNPPPPSPGLGLLLHPQVGNTGVRAGNLDQINLVLGQTFVGAVAGRTYTFTGDVLIQNAYSGIVETLNPNTPLGDYNLDTVVNAADYTIWRDTLGSTEDFRANGTNDGASLNLIDQADYDYWKARFGHTGRPAGVTSPTETMLELTFLNSSDVELATTVFDLRDDLTVDAWRTNQVQAVAPAGSNKVRVRFKALDMVDNCCTGGQDVLLDNFSLRDSVVTGLERLTNGNLNTPGEPAGWTLTEGPTVDQGSGPITADSAAFIGFANRKVEDTVAPIDPAGVPTGNQGLWLRSFVNTTQFEPDIESVDAVATQIVNATPGAHYEFSAWSAFEQGFSGGLQGTSTETFLKMEFLNAAMSVLSSSTVNPFDVGQMNDDGDNGSGNVDWADWRLTSLNAVAPAGTAKVRVSLGATGMFASGLGVSQSGFFDEMSLVETLPGAGSLAAVPEPGLLVLLMIAFGVIGVGRRMR